MKTIKSLSLLFLVFLSTIVNAQSDSLKYVVSADTTPKYIKGEDSLFIFIQRNISYPMEARSNGIQGKVYISFVIDTLGNVRDLSLLRDIGEGCGHAAMEVINKTSGNWIPAFQDGMKVNYKMTFPVLFKIGPTVGGR